MTWKRFFDSDAEECLLRPKLEYLKQEAEYFEECVGRVPHIGTLSSEVASIMPRLGTVMLNRTNYRAVHYRLGRKHSSLSQTITVGIYFLDCLAMFTFHLSRTSAESLISSEPQLHKFILVRLSTINLLWCNGLKEQSMLFQRKPLTGALCMVLISQNPSNPACYIYLHAESIHVARLFLKSIAVSKVSTTRPTLVIVVSWRL